MRSRATEGRPKAQRFGGPGAHRSDAYDLEIEKRVPDGMQGAQIAVMKMGGRGDFDGFGAGTFPPPPPSLRRQVTPHSNRSTTK